MAGFACAAVLDFTNEVAGQRNSNRHVSIYIFCFGLSSRQAPRYDSSDLISSEFDVNIVTFHDFQQLLLSRRRYPQ